VQHPQAVFYFDSPMPAAAKGLVHNHMVCKQTIGTGMVPTIFWSASAEGACVLNYKTQLP
jgi:hypothetical protein